MNIPATNEKVDLLYTYKPKCSHVMTETLVSEELSRYHSNCNNGIQVNKTKCHLEFLDIVN